jgi:hypothetical protein
MDAEPYTISISDETLRDMRERLERTRWPDEIPGVGWDYGVSPEYLKAWSTTGGRISTGGYTRHD